MYRIEFAKDVVKDLVNISPYYRNRILRTIEDNLLNEPVSSARNRKILINLVPPWDAVPPVWELRIGLYRVFYDVDEEKKIVYVRAIREKLHGKTTEEIL